MAVEAQKRSRLVRMVRILVRLPASKIEHTIGEQIDNHEEQHDVRPVSLALLIGCLALVPQNITKRPDTCKQKTASTAF